MKPCPFCKSENIELAPRVGFPVQIQCCNCGALGPLKLTGREAEATWNSQPYADYFSTLCKDQADDHDYLQKLCREAGCEEWEINGYPETGCPTIQGLADVLVNKLKKKP